MGSGSPCLSAHKQTLLKDALFKPSRLTNKPMSSSFTSLDRPWAHRNLVRICFCSCSCFCLIGFKYCLSSEIRLIFGFIRRNEIPRVSPASPRSRCDFYVGWRARNPSGVCRGPWAERGESGRYTPPCCDCCCVRWGSHCVEDVCDLVYRSGNFHSESNWARLTEVMGRWSSLHTKS